ncbi:MAG: alkaline phosphatase family protein, partial [Planctomycetota bacterium]
MNFFRRRLPWVLLTTLLAWTACAKPGADGGAPDAACPSAPETALAPPLEAPPPPGLPVPTPPRDAPPPPAAGAAGPAAPPGTPKAGPEPQTVLLISWDGLDRSVAKELLAKERLPNLAALIREGSLQDIDVRGHVTVTKPGHAEMLTGLGVETTGVYSNQRYRPIPAGLTIFERLQDSLGGPGKIRTFMVTGKVAHVGGRGPADSPPGEGAGAGKKAGGKKGAGRKGFGKKGLGKGKGLGRENEAAGRPEGWAPAPGSAVPPGADDSPEKETVGEP